MGDHSILLAESDYHDRLAWSEQFRQWGYDVTAVGNGAAAWEKIQAHEYDLIIADIDLPQMDGLELLDKTKDRNQEVPVALISGQARVECVVEAMKRGAFDFLLKSAVSEAMGHVITRALGVRGNPSRTKSPKISAPLIITQDPSMLRCLEIARKVAGSKAPVLLQGDSGTGKELLARYIHQQSPRRDKAFVAVNCAALPVGLLESELFGHEKGAFTGAAARKLGRFELAKGGTILLDEISEMELPLQAKLLRVLQESEIDRLGGQGPIPIDVRVIATTNRDMESAIAAKEFRGDLYYRISVIPIHLPRLRDRRGDILLLADHFIEKYNRIDGRNVKGLTEDAARTLTALEWRGNVRELENTMERAVLLTPSDWIDAEHLFLPSCTEELADTGIPPLAGGTLKEMERRMIFEALGQTDGNRTHAAEMLGISVRTLRNKLNEYRQNMDDLTAS